MAATYTIGLDFGTDSVRALLVDTNDGRELATAVHPYRRWAGGAYCLPSENQFRQHPQDYSEGIEATVTDVLAQVSRDVRDGVIGIGVDTTGSTPVAVDRTGTPLALLPDFADNPHAMFVLWKDHTAVAEAEKINQLAATWPTNYLTYSGGIYSSEWFWAKALKISREDPTVHRAAYSWVEHCDWIPFLLTGGTDVHEMKRSRCAAGHKALWHPSWGGLPPNDFFVALDPLLDGLTERLYTDTYTADLPVGTLSPDWANRLGLSTSVTISGGAFDAHMGAVGAQAEPFYLTKIMGTSTCDILVAPAGQVDHPVAGICGQVEGSVIPGMLGLEAGQSAFGDLYAWFQRLVSWPLLAVLRHSTLLDQATKDALIAETVAGVLPALSEAAAREPIGAAGELALDWMNGRRTPDANQQLTGVLAGINLGSDAPKLFRALVEASCFGARLINDRFIAEGVPIRGVIALGGVARKSSFIMQMLADVLGMPISVAATDQTCALGAAMFAAVAAGAYDTVGGAAGAMGGGFDATYYPDAARSQQYTVVFDRYQELAATLEPLLSHP